MPVFNGDNATPCSVIRGAPQGIERFVGARSTLAVSTALFIMVFCAIVSGCASGPKVGSMAGSFTAIDGQGQSLTSEDCAGKVTVLYFWATWCAPCVVSSPALQKIHEKYVEDDRVQVVGVHFNATGDPVAYSENHGYTFTIVPDGNSIVEVYGVKKIPQIVILSPDREVVYTQIGFKSGDEKKLQQVIEEYR